jgi:hypothetical protein
MDLLSRGINMMDIEKQKIKEMFADNKFRFMINRLSTSDRKAIFHIFMHNKNKLELEDKEIIELFSHAQPSIPEISKMIVGILNTSKKDILLGIEERKAEIDEYTKEEIKKISFIPDWLTEVL